MFVRRVTSVTAVAFAALAASVPATAHVIVTPAFVAAGGRTPLELAVPNERRVPMTGFVVLAPAGVEVVAAQPAAGWTDSASGRTASWHGGRLAPRLQANFILEVDAPSAPGTATFEAVQHYPDGGVVRWPVTLTITPADEPSQQLGLALVAGLVGLLALTIGGALVWRRAGRSLQEK